MSGTDRGLALLTIALIVSNVVYSTLAINIPFSSEDLKNFKNAVVIDAGSTGSRAYVFNISVEFDYNYSPDSDSASKFLVRPHIPYFNHKINNGVLELLTKSTFTLDCNSDIGHVSPSSPIYLHFKQILEFVDLHVDKKNRSFTPVFFFATAGMRLLEYDECQFYLNQLRALTKIFFSEYLFHDNYSVKVLSGQEEGIHSFISTQELMYVQSGDKIGGIVYDLGTFNNSDYDDRLLHISRNNIPNSFKYASIIEFGGASIQVVSPLPNAIIAGDYLNDSFYKQEDFVSGNSSIKQYLLNNDICKLNYDSRSIHLFAKSYLGLGKQMALIQYLHMIYKNRDKEYGEAACLPIGYKALLPELKSSEIKSELDEIIAEKYDEYGNIIPFVVGTGVFDLCNKQIEKLLDAIVDTSIPYVIQDESIIIGSENIFYTLKFLKPINGKNYHESITAEELEDLGRMFCTKSVFDLEPYFFDGAEPEKIYTACFTVNYIAKLFTKVLSLGKTRVIYPKNTIMGNSLSWALSVPILDIPNFINAAFKN